MRLCYKYLQAVTVLLFVLTGIVLAQSSPVITKVEASTGYIRVEWTINSEAGIDHYEIWRSSGSSEPILIGNVQRGNFYFEDKNNLYKTVDQYFKYKVKAISGANGSILGQSGIVGTHFYYTSSTYKRTWGSIKAMFR